MPPPIEIGKPLPTHPDYSHQRQARDFWRRSDRARWDYAAGMDASLSSILPQHPMETMDRYRERRSAAIVRPYVRSILDRFCDYVCARKDTTRPEPTGPYGDFVEDATGTGVPLPRFMRDRLRQAQSEGVSYILCDAAQPGQFQTAAEEQQAGQRGVARPIGADHVLWWRSWGGQILEALVVLSDRDGRDFGWHVTETTTQRIDLERDKEGRLIVLSMQAAVQHRYSACPLVPLCPIAASPEDCGWTSQAAPIAESQRRICNFESWLWEELKRATFTTPVFLGVSPDMVKGAEVGPGKALCLPSQGATNPALDKLGADPAQAESLRSSISNEVQELYRAAGISGGSPLEVGQPESGIAKAFAFQDLEASLAALSRCAEEAENAIVMRLSAAFGWGEIGPARWPRDFALSDVARDLDYVIRLSTATLPAVLQERGIRDFADKAFRLSGEEKARLEAEIPATAARLAEPPEPTPFT